MGEEWDCRPIRLEGMLLSLSSADLQSKKIITKTLDDGVGRSKGCMAHYLSCIF